MTRPEPGQPILVAVGDKVVEIKYPLGVLKELDRVQQVSVLSGGMVAAFQDPQKLAAVLYYGLKTRQPDITQEWVDDNIDASMLNSIIPLVAYAMTGRWSKAFDEEPDAQAPPDPTQPATRLTGSASGLSDATTSALVTQNSGH